MPTLTPGKPVTLPTPELLVENRLAAGQYRFQLVVIDDSGLESAPAELVVTVRRPLPDPPPVTTGPVIRPDLINRFGRPVIGNVITPIRRPQ